MDPVSLTASGIAFIHVARQLGTCISIARNIKDAPRDVQDLQTELHHLKLTLRAVEGYIQTQLGSEDTGLSQCLVATVATVDSVQHFLRAKATGFPGAKLSRRRSLQWALHRSTAARLRNQLSVRRSELSMLITAETLQVQTHLTNQWLLSNPLPPATHSPPASPTDDGDLAETTGLEDDSHSAQQYHLGIATPTSCDPRLEDERDDIGLRYRGHRSNSLNAASETTTVEQLESSHPEDIMMMQIQSDRELLPLHVDGSRRCHCSCHRPWRLSSPRALRPLMGQWSVSPKELQISQTWCSPCCTCSPQAKVSAHYIPPAWACSWMFQFNILGSSPLGQPERLWKTRHLVYTEAYRLAQIGDVPGLQTMYISGHASIHDANPEEGQSALLVAIWCGQAEVVRFLLDHGATTEESTFDGLEIIDAAFRHVYGNVSPAGPLISHLMHLSDHLPDQQFSLAHRIVLGLSSKDLATVLTEQPELASAVDLRSRSALWWAALRQDAPACRTLLRFNANPNNADYQGETIMQNAAGTPRADILAMLIAAGGNLSPGDGLRETPLHYAARSDARLTNVKLLLKHGADVNATNANGVTAMHEALQADAIDVAEALIRAGIHLDTPDMYGDRYWHLAVVLPAPKILALLVGVGCDLKRPGKGGRTVRDCLALHPNRLIEKLLDACGQ